MHNKKNPKTKKIFRIVGLIVFLFLAIFLFSIYSESKKPVTIKVSNSAVTLNGLSDGKDVIQVANIKGVEYVTQKLELKGSISGGSVENKIFGLEDVNDFKEIYCYIENSQYPSLLIKTNNQNYLINTSNKEEIKNDYIKLKSLIKS